jgi:anti-sigma B factor antagonist
VKLRTLDFRRLHHPLSAPLVAIPLARNRDGGSAELGVVRAIIELPDEGLEPPLRRHPLLTVVMEQCGQTLVLAVDGEVDLDTVHTMRQALESALSHRPRRLVVDLSLVRFLNSAGLEVLLAAHRQAAPHTDLRLVATTRATWRPLQITRLHEQLIIHASRTEAVAAPARSGDEGRSPPVGAHQSIPSLESTPS